MTRSTAREIDLRDLVMVEEDDAWVVGRPETGEFVALPNEAVTFLKALRESGLVEEAEERVREIDGVLIDSEDFIAALLQLDYIANIDGEQQPDTALPPSLPGLRSEHVRWLFSPLANVVVIAVFLAGVVSAVLRHDLVPSYHAFFVTDLDGVNIALNTALFLLVVAAHELNHLAAARADEVHARIGLGTRLTMLAATTTVSGMWAASRRSRFRVYLAGIRFDLVTAAVLSLLMWWVDPVGLAGRLAESLRLAILMSVITQFALYMRTDMYFVAQEAMRCRNLYHDAWAHLRHVATRARDRAGQVDPVLLLPPHERRPVRIYAWFMLLGSLATLASFALFGGPIVVSLFGHAFTSVASGWTDGSPVRLVDGLLVLAVEGTLQAVFVIVFLRNHASTMRRLLTRARGRAPGGPLGP